MPPDPTPHQGFGEAIKNIDALESAKASSVPVDDQERAKAIIYTSGQPTVAHTSPKPDTVYGPFDIEYEIKEVLSPGWVPTYNDPDNSSGAPNAEPMEVAILLPEIDEDPIIKHKGEEHKFKLVPVTPSKSGKLKQDASTIFPAFEKFGEQQPNSVARPYTTPYEPVGKLEEKEEPGVSKLKIALQDKIMEFEAYRTDPNHQTEMEQNAVIVTLRELKYLDSIVEYE